VNTFSPRARVLVFFGIALLALVGLAMTLNALQMDPGKPLSFYQLAPQIYDPGMPGGLERTLLAAIRVLLILGWVVLPAYALLLVFSKRARKQFLRDMATFLPIVIMLYLLSRAKTSQNAAEQINPRMFNIGGLAEGQAGSEVPPPVYQAPPEWLTTTITVGLVVIISLAVVLIFLALYRRSKGRALEPLHHIQQEAQAALDAIEAGGDLREVIIRCYVQMIEALRQYRSIQRDRDMTPHEFEAYLEQRGLPLAPVQQLTLLFEQARYSGSTPARQDERAAVASLTAIIAACQRVEK
jgi:hypothetical protein